MSIELLDLLTTEDGRPRLAHSMIELRSSGTDLLGGQAKMSKTFGCTSMVFVVFPPGFQRSNRTADRVQIAVVLEGQLKITARDEESFLVGPGGVIRMPKAEKSEHTMEVVGTNSVTLMVLLE